MSYAPGSLLEARSYLMPKTGLSANALGIVGSTATHFYGYHLGKDRLPPGYDYSKLVPRDINGLTDAASALDIGWFPRLVDLTMFVVTEARNGRVPDLREIIGPAPDGRAYRYDHLNGWTAELRREGDDHQRHTHTGWYRDSEGRSKVPVFKRFFEGVGLVPVGAKVSVPWNVNLYDWTAAIARGYQVTYDLNIMRDLNPWVAPYIKWLPGPGYKIPIFHRPTPPVRIR